MSTCPDSPADDVADVFKDQPAGGVLCRCPHCGSTLATGRIPVESFSWYGYAGGDKSTLCRHGCGRPPHYSRLFGVYDVGRDRITEWQCPDCGTRWAR